jgi:hypothetical protein
LFTKLENVNKLRSEVNQRPSVVVDAIHSKATYTHERE